MVSEKSRRNEFSEMTSRLSVNILTPTDWVANGDEGMSVILMDRWTDTTG